MNANKFFNTKKGGFVFIDALMAIVLLSIGIVALLAAYTQSTKVSIAATERQTALYLAQSELKDAENYSPSRLSQLLGEIADHGLISSRKRGRNKDWRLTERGQQVLIQYSPSQASRTSKIAQKTESTANYAPCPSGRSVFILRPQQREAA